MKQLIMVRHGKSSWDLGVEDRDRPLKERGVKDAHKVSRHFGAFSVKPDMVFSSPAIRALHTCVIFLRVMKIPYQKFSLADGLYVFSGNELLDFLRDLPDSQDKIMIFGHNHAFTEIVNELGDVHIDNVPTTGLVHLSFNIRQWKDIKRGKTERVVIPKELSL
ncbi:MAG: histidine phosphatase family protein [Flavobacteriaceae bacterium]|nr:histidine phosphatase family protein [Muriicola sp.]NNC61305.1 histidine phosphatase family protein [Eudoraea sp.]NNK21061.1 histidine phosphatase family protein [Flavobacteriaceae bacterium]MBT8289950.1 histidine phosphatase family protein [Muriicola sp.]NNK35143.1 histidine phosphatase family protein [Eudoraea sp.]